MTRVLLVHQPTDGGVGRHVRDLAIGLSERGEEVVLCGPARPAGVPDGVSHVQLDLRRALAPRNDLMTLARFWGIVRQVRPGLVHAHSSKAGAIARLDRFSHPRVPVIYTPHGYAFAGHFSRELERSAYRAIEAGLARLTTRVVCVCEAEARLARKVGASNRVRVVHNGIEPAGDGPVEERIAELSSRGPVICALTLLRPGKGLETLLDTAPRILARHPTAQIAIGGGGPDLESLQGRAAQLGVADAVHFLGPTADPLSFLRGATLFVHPSWAESFPYVVLEAMSLGLPIVASDVGGISEALVDGESGLLVAPGDETGLATSMLSLLENPAEGTRLGAAAKQRVEQRFTRTAMIEQLLAVYAEALSTSRPAAA